MLLSPSSVGWCGGDFFFRVKKEETGEMRQGGPSERLRSALFLSQAPLPCPPQGERGQGASRRRPGTMPRRRPVRIIRYIFRGKNEVKVSSSRSIEKKEQSWFFSLSFSLFSPSLTPSLFLYLSHRPVHALDVLLPRLRKPRKQTDRSERKRAEEGCRERRRERRGADSAMQSPQVRLAVPVLFFFFCYVSRARRADRI